MLAILREWLFPPSVLDESRFFASFGITTGQELMVVTGRGLRDSEMMPPDNCVLAPLTPVNKADKLMNSKET